MTSLADFRRACAIARPRSAVVLGSGLADVAHAFAATHAVAYAQQRGRRGHPVGFSAELYSELVEIGRASCRERVCSTV